MKKYEEIQDNDETEEPEDVKKFFDGLAEYIKRLPRPKETIKVINPSVYARMMRSKAFLEKYLTGVMENGTIKLKLNPEFRTGCLSVEMIDVTVDNPRLFKEIIGPSDCFEVYPLVNGHVKFELTFQSMFVSLRP